MSDDIMNDNFERIPESQREHIMRTIAALPQPVSLPATVIEAWRRHPDRFGLTHDGQSYPDSNRVLSSIYGKTGLVRRGYLIGNKKTGFSMTDLGTKFLEVVDSFRWDDEQQLLQAKGIVDPLIMAAASAAYVDFEKGDKSGISFDKALMFWSMRRRDQAKYSEKLGEFEKLLNGRESSHLRCLGACHDWLKDRFAHQLGLDWLGKRMRKVRETQKAS